MFSVVTGDPREIADEMLTNPDLDLVTFTGGVPIGKYIAAKAVYKRQVLELGGNDPIIVLEDANVEEAAALAAAGSYKNSGQRCTAVKRMLVHEAVADRFVELLLARTQKPGPTATRWIRHVDMGTVIDEAAAKSFEAKVNEAVAGGAKLLHGNVRRGALYSPTLVDHVTPDMPLVKYETFGPVSPVIRFRNLDEAIRISNSTDYRTVVRRLHESPRLHHAARVRAQRRLGQRPRGPGLSARADAVRRHQGFGAGLQGGRAGSDEELHEYQDLLPAMVIGNSEWPMARDE